MGNIAIGVLNLCVFNGKRVIPDRAILNIHSALDRIDFQGRDNNVIIAHIVPGIRRRIMIGICVVCHDVRERLFRILIQCKFRESSSVLTHFPYLQVGGTVCRMLCCRHELETAIVVQVRDRIIPLHLRGRLFHCVQIGIDQA